MKKTKVLIETKEDFFRNLDNELSDIGRGKKNTFDENTISIGISKRKKNT